MCSEGSKSSVVRRFDALEIKISCRVGHIFIYLVQVVSLYHLDQVVWIKSTLHSRQRVVDCAHGGTVKNWAPPGHFILVILAWSRTQRRSTPSVSNTLFAATMHCLTSLEDVVRVYSLDLSQKNCDMFGHASYRQASYFSNTGRLYKSTTLRAFETILAAAP